jgi:type III restriction enzyme
VLFWSTPPLRGDTAAIGTVVAQGLPVRGARNAHDYLSELAKHRGRPSARCEALRDGGGARRGATISPTFPRKAWEALRKPADCRRAFAEQPHSSRFDGAGRPIPNVCLKVPDRRRQDAARRGRRGARVLGHWLRRSTGLVLWVVPNEAIYRQTLKALSDRDHPYRQILNVAGAGRVKILEKNAPLTRLDVDSHLCVMLLMLQSAARQSKETLRFFRDRGNVLGFLPREDDIDAHWELLRQVPNLDAYAPWGMSAEEARAQKGSIVKSSLGNVMRLMRPMVVIDEGHHAYSETALKTLDGFNPCLLLELSATPRVASARASGSNILVDVRGTDLDEAEMIKLPIQVDVQALERLAELPHGRGATARCAAARGRCLHAEWRATSGPSCWCRWSAPGAIMRDAGFIHADDARRPSCCSSASTSGRSRSRPRRPTS